MVVYLLRLENVIVDAVPFGIVRFIGQLHWVHITTITFQKIVIKLFSSRYCTPTTRSTLGDFYIFKNICTGAYLVIASSIHYDMTQSTIILNYR